MSVDTAFNTAAKEYLLVYAYDASGAGTNWDIYGQRVDEDGTKIGAAFAIMSTGYSESKPQAAYNSTNNEYLIVAEYDSIGAGLYQTRVQRVSAGGSIIGGPIDIFATANSQNSPCIAYNSTNNQYLVGIETDYTGDGKSDLLRMVLNGSGEVLSGQYNYLSGYHFKKIKLAYNTQQNEYLSVFEL